MGGVLIAVTTFESFYLLFFVHKYKCEIFAPQIAGKLVVTGQDKYMNNTSYLIKTKNLKLIENLSDCN